MDIDYDRVSALLNIVEKAAGHSGKLGALSNAAQSELLALNEKIRTEAAKAAAAATAAAQPKVIEPEDGDTDPDSTPRPSSKTDEVAKNNMRRV